MALLKDSDRQEIARMLAALEQGVRLVMFTQEHECQYCQMTHQLVEEVAGLSEKVTAEIHDFLAEADPAKRHGIARIPAVAVLGEKDHGIRLYGVPAGYEFPSLLEAIVMVGRGDPELPEAILSELAKVDQPVHLQVMVTPTCPYCSRAVIMAHKFALANERITADMVEVSEFPQVALRYQVQGVPKTVINEQHGFVGALPEGEAVKQMLAAIGK